MYDLSPDHLGGLELSRECLEAVGTVNHEKCWFSIFLKIHENPYWVGESETRRSQGTSHTRGGRQPRL